MTKRHIVVIGAGVTGLQTGVTLLEAKKYDVTIITKSTYEDNDPYYTSLWAGAQWRTHASEDDLRQQKWDIETYDHWMDLIARENKKSGEPTSSGLTLIPSTLYRCTPSTSPQRPPWFAPHVQSYIPIPPSSLPSNTTAGATYTSLTIWPPLYLSHLTTLFLSLGGRILKHTLPSPLPLALATASLLVPTTSGFVNCTGLAARSLVPDETVYPIAGQTVRVRGVAGALTTVEGGGPGVNDAGPKAGNGGVTYLIPQPSEELTVLGGTKEEGNWSTVPEPGVTREILERCGAYAPELLDEGGFEVLDVRVGLRPGRRGGVRVEGERVRMGDGKGEWVVVHSYGHAGAGFQNSVGCASEVVRVLEGMEVDGERKGPRLMGMELAVLMYRA
ncbi:nucleotide-binding domain-containing protein [Patellaria atrata CBS 101060]|uniref:Nucleotide-binding domain-containing protein n=1 Tax=Patellaria atrata CBS 101060 TaxID=1346257 RepID=A0A9P4S7Y5_9PEZI|nr:nucleotide-binding domain-containing protein [Patellaria atrata CBS 101060]